MIKNNLDRELNKLCTRLQVSKLSQALCFPQFFELETINACNAKCIMCTIADWPTFNQSIISDKIFEKFVKEVKDYTHWIKMVCLCHNGEPLLDKYLEERIKILKAAGIKYITFSTNASLLTEDRAKGLLGSGLDDIMLSVDGFSKETYEAVRVGLDYEEVVQNCLNFIKMRDRAKSKVTIRARMIRLKENEHELDSWEKFWRGKLSLRDRVCIRPMHTWGNQLSNYQKRQKAGKISPPCVSPWSTMIVHADGAVSLCTIDYNRRMIMGDFSKQSIKEVWTGDLFQKIRQCHSLGRKNKLELCKGCTIWEVGRNIEA